ncbi:MAG: hypothetical protein ISN64_01940 [Rickettsia sp.]|nr:hypothetical protein [Rickettsia sp.]
MIKFQPKELVKKEYGQLSLTCQRVFIYDLKTWSVLNRVTMTQAIQDLFIKIETMNNRTASLALKSPAKKKKS